MAPLAEVQGEGAQSAWRYSSSVPPGETRTQREIWGEKEELYEKANAWECTCTQAACVFCGKFADLPGTYRWSGTGLFEYLDGDSRDPPPAPQGYYSYSQHGRRFGRVPRPPDRWRGLPLEATDNGGELPAPSEAPPPRRSSRSGGGSSSECVAS
jgi:hypothetical protein